MKIFNRKNFYFNLHQRTATYLPNLNPIYKNSLNQKFSAGQKFEKRFFNWKKNFIGFATSCIIATLSLTLTAYCESDQFESNKKRKSIFSNH